MKDEAGTASPSAATLHAALLDYYSAPGKYQLTLRQPATLFASIREILQVAAGRGTQPAAEAATLREAATFFIRAALLYPGADHYALMGYPPAGEPSDLKERYRLLMRLIHPDFAEAGAAAWPADAAVRVNRAYEVLSSPTLRREYREQLAALRQQRPSASGKAPGPIATVLPRRPQEPRLQVGRKAAWALGITLGGIAVLMLMPRQEPEHLVQRKRPASGPPQHTPLALPAPVSPPEPVVRPTAATPVPVAPEAPSTLALLDAERLGSPLPPPGPPQVAVPPTTAAPVRVPAPPAAAAVKPPPPMPAAATPANRVVAAPAAPPRPPQEAARPIPAPTSVPAAQEPPPAPVPPPLPAPVVAAVAVAPVASTPISAPAASTPATARVSTTVAAMVPASPTLDDAQPLLTQVLQMLETGSGEQVLRLLDKDARQGPGAQALSRNYEMMIKGARPVRLTQVEFRGEPRDGVLLVTGRIRVHAGETTIGSHGERFLLRAEFASRGGKVMLTNLSGAPD